MSEEENKTGVEYEGDAVPTSENLSDAQQEQRQKEEFVPLSALQSERAHRQQMQEELQMLKEHVSLMRNREEPKQKPSSDPFEQYSDDDIPTVGEIKKLFNEREQQFKTHLTELQMAQRHPDYVEVISNYLPEVINKNPSLRKTLEQTQDYELAYYLAKNSDSYREKNKSVQKNSDAERIIKNSQQSGSLASVGSSSPINTAKRYKEMSDSEFRKEMTKNMGLV